MSIRRFIDINYRHFNAATLRSAAQSYLEHIDSGYQMMITLAGAMSTAELGISLAEMIRQNKVHAISCTGANLEEDLFNLLAHDHYERVPHYRYLSAADEVALRDRGLARVTDTCIPEEEAMRKLEGKLLQCWKNAEEKNERYFPHEFCYQVILSEVLKDQYQIDERDSWLVEAYESTHHRWVFGVQWHPERIFELDDGHRRLWKDFLAACKDKGSLTTR